MRPRPLAAALLAAALAACSAPPPPPEAPPDRARIVPVLKPRTWLAAAEASLGAAPGAMPAWDPLGPDLCVVYAEDRPTTVRILSEAQVGALGLSREALRELAGRNLATVVPEMHVRGQEGVWVIEAGGVYESSLVFWAGLGSGRLAVKGDPVVAVPTRGVLLVTGSEDASGLARVRALAAEAAAASPDRLTSTLYVRRGGRLEPFAPPVPAAAR